MLILCNFYANRWLPDILQNSWLIVSNQIVKSLPLCYKKSYGSEWFNLLDPTVVFCQMIEIIEQTFSIMQIFYLGPNFLFLAR